MIPAKEMKILLLMFILFALALSACATGGDSKKDLVLANKPELVVYEYCKADAYGARLSTDTVKATTKFYVQNSPPELGWTYIYLISDFKVQQTLVEGDTAKVFIIYDYLATLDLVKKDVYVEDFPFLVEFNLTKENGLWKINSFKTLPCVYKDAALAFLKNQFKSSTNQDEEDRLLALIEKVKALKED
jgi:hypothetical protein